ncbi:MAG: DJ-1/PfpI family protein [Ignavibacteriae bacterium]|nr:DJ-1/PfpI family protein [Ignavibacteriota bacterium]
MTDHQTLKLTLLRCAAGLFLALSGIQTMTTHAQQAPMRVGILVYEGVYLLDFAGPMEVFTDAALADTSVSLQVFTVSADGAPIHAHSGLGVTPAHGFANCPQADILVVPGGDREAAEKDSAVAAWIRAQAAGARIVLSVCTGAFILAKLGLLDGCEATTWHGALRGLTKVSPAIKTRTGVRWTDNGTIVTTAGISAGIDGSLHVLSRLYGAETARLTAAYMDYEYWTGKPATGR